MLILQGTKDIQVSTADADLLHKANPQSKLVIIEGMNHILKDVAGNETENIATYNNKTLPINTALIKEISSFMLNSK